MAKLIQVSSDDITYENFPGSSGDFNVEAEGITDTIFGQSFNSTQTGILSWSVSANAYWKGFAGYVATIKKSGTATAMTTEATTELTGTTFQVTDTTKRVLDRTSTFTATASVSGDVTGNISNIDYLYGIFTFDVDLTGETVTVDGDYLPMAAYGKAMEFTLTQSADSIESTDFDTAQGNGGFRTYVPGLRQVSLDMSGFFATANGFKDLLTSRSEVVIEINPDGNAESMCRGFFKPMSTGQSGEVGGTEDETITFELAVPYSATETITPFSWSHAVGSGIPLAVKTCLTAWQDETLIYVSYKHDGTNGWKGQSVITDFSLSSGLSAMNEFSASFQGSDAYTAVP